MVKRRRLERGYKESPNWPYKWQAGAAKRVRNRFSELYPRGSAASKANYGTSYKEANPAQKDMRKALRFSGPGDYKSYWRKGRKYIPRGLGAIGSDMLGMGPGSGYKTGAAFSKAIGWGDYSMNQIVNGPSRMNPHQNVHHVGVSGDLSGDIIYSNTEFVKNVYVTGPVSVGTSVFQNDSLAINPGMQETFPFLSQIAQNFELFEFQGLMFQYKPNSGTFGNSNSNSLGKVVLCTNYDPGSADFPSAVVMENYDYACSTLPSEGCLHGVECLPSQRSTNQLYTRTGDSSKDLIFTDLGKFQIATEGVPFGAGGQTALIGELWVTYTVKLSRAKLQQVVGNSILHGTYRGTGSTDFGNNMANAIVDADNTVSCTFANISTVSARLDFDRNLQGKRVLVTCMLSVALAAGNRFILGTPVASTVVYQDDAIESPPNTAILNAVIDCDNSPTTSSVIIGTNTIPSAATIIDITVTVVDPQFNITIA